MGESGSGKTTLSLATLAYARPGASITEGHARIAGQDLLAASPGRVQSSRGRLIAYIPQDPATALNPSLRVEVLLREMLRAHRPGGDWDPAVGAALAKVGLPTDAAFRRRFPHQLSGGQQQRLTIAIALICEPSVLVMDEPTTGLDVITQSVILAEIKRLCQETGVAIVYVSHDLAVVSEIASQIAVMYAGRIVEHGPAANLLRRPRHPYTLGLISSIPDHREPRELRGIPGVAVGVTDRPPGCAFAPRCGQRAAECESAVPPLEAVGPGHAVRCIRTQLTPETCPGRTAADQGAAAQPAAAGRPAAPGRAPRTRRRCRRRRQRHLRRRAARMPGAGRRIRQRQDHHRALYRRAAPAHRGDAGFRRPAAGRAGARGGRVTSGAASRSSSRTPTTRSTPSTPWSSRSPGRCCCSAWPASARCTGRWPSCWARSGFRPARPGAIPRNCPAGNASAWP